MLAIGETAMWGYGAGLAFGVAVLLIARGRR